jgi:hypothetical protein
MDRDAAKRILAVIEPPYIEFHQEQHQFNYWVWKSGVTVNHLPPEFNRYGRCLRTIVVLPRMGRRENR